MVAYKGYWKGAPKIDEIIFENYTNQDTMTMDLKAGNLDVAFGVPVAQFNALKSEPGIKVQAADQKYLVELAFNTYASPNSQANPVMQDMKFRQAVSWAVDKSKIVATCMGGYADVGQSILVPSTDDAWTPTDAEKFGYDPEKAKQLLDAAGYKDSNGDGVREDKQGQPIKLRLWTRSESPEQQRAGKLIAGSFESIGIGIELAVMNDGSISDGIWTYKGSTYAPDYDMFIWGWSGNIDPDYMLADFITSQIEMWNDACWSDKEYDSLYQQQASEMDAAKRKDEVTRMQQIFYQQAPYAVLYYPKALIAYNTAKWEGWVPYPSSNGLVVLSGDNIDSYRLVHPVVATTESTSKSSSTTYIVDRRHRRDHRDHPRGRARAARPRARAHRIALPTAGGRPAFRRPPAVLVTSRGRRPLHLPERSPWNSCTSAVPTSRVSACRWVMSCARSTAASPPRAAG